MANALLDPRSLANYILVIRRHFGFSTTNLELQKLSYFAYGKFLVSYDQKLCEGFFEAWEHGPVHPMIYREFKRFGASPIEGRAESRDLLTGEKQAIPLPRDPKVRTHIAETVLQLRGLTASQLRQKSHVKGGPWDVVWQRTKTNLVSQVLIPDSVIREGFGRHIWVASSTLSEEDIPLEDHPPEFDRGS